MNRKLFGRNDRRAQLQDLYREAEIGGDPRDVDARVQQEFAADQQLTQQLGRFAALSAPVNPAIGRAAFLASVARQKSESHEEEGRPMIGKLLGARGLALLAVAGIFAGGAATVGASGGVGGAAGHANDVLSTLHITHKAQDEGHANDGASEPEDAATPADGQDANEGAREPRGADTPDAEGTSRAVEGIPTENPQHHPADADGTCDKGETIVKTTPSGVAVNVPCQTGEDHGQANANNNSDETRVADDTPEADETPEANATEPDKHSGEGGEHTPVPLPTQANHHATERAGNSSGH